MIQYRDILEKHFRTFLHLFTFSYYVTADMEVFFFLGITDYLLFIFLFFIFGHNRQHVGILVPLPEIEPVTPALEVSNSNHWTARNIPIRAI